MTESKINKMMTSLRSFAIPKKLVDLVGVTLNGFTAKVKIQGDATKPFQVKCGVRQEDALTLLFISVPVSALTNVGTQGIRIS